MSKLSRNEKAMLFAQGIVERYKARGNKLPHRSKTCRMDPNRVQEYKDAAKLNDWKQSLKGNRGTCSDEIRDYLDANIPSWRDSVSMRAHRRNDSDEENDGSLHRNSAPNSRRLAVTENTKKRKRRETFVKEEDDDEEEIARQILRDSQLLMQLRYSMSLL